MPAAKKSTNTKQKQSLISKLKLNTLKGRILATVLVFAVIGGGLAVYKSFAYAPNNGQKQTFSYTVAAGTLRADDSIPGFQWNTVDKPSIYKESSKNNTQVIKLPGISPDQSQPNYATITDKKWGITIPQGQVYDWCATLKGYFNDTGSSMYLADPDYQGYRTNIDNVGDLDNTVSDLGNGYVIRCSKAKITARYKLVGPFYLAHSSKKDGYVASIDLRFY